MTDNDRKSIMAIADTIQGEINRMCVAKSLSEVDAMYMHAQKNLINMMKLIYYARFKSEGEEDKNMVITNREYLDSKLSSILRCACHIEGYNRSHMYYRVKGSLKLRYIETKKVIADIDKEG